MTELTKPAAALFDDVANLPVIRACDHYAGSLPFLTKAFALQRELGAIFDVTGDLEDGAPVGREREHLDDVISILRSPENHYRAAGIRIHDYHHPMWREEVERIVDRIGDIVAHLTIPKAEDRDTLDIIIEYIQKRCEKVGLKRKIPLHVLIETPHALHEVWEIAKLPWIRALEFGVMDFVSSHKGALPGAAMRTPGQFSHHLLVRAKSEIVSAAIANNLIPVHNVTINHKDPQQAGEDARVAKEQFGFLRMWSIHPEQIRPIVTAMSPTFAEVQEGATILVRAQETNWGPLSLDGHLYDRASYRYYWELLQRARLSGVEIPQLAKERLFN